MPLQLVCGRGGVEVRFVQNQFSNIVEHNLAHIFTRLVCIINNFVFLLIECKHLLDSEFRRYHCCSCIFSEKIVRARIADWHKRLIPINSRWMTILWHSYSNSINGQLEERVNLLCFLEMAHFINDSKCHQKSQQSIIAPRLVTLIRRCCNFKPKQ